MHNILYLANYFACFHNHIQFILHEQKIDFFNILRKGFLFFEQNNNKFSGLGCDTLKIGSTEVLLRKSRSTNSRHIQ